MQKNIILLMKLSFFGILSALFGFYFFHQMRAYLSGPKISVEFPKNGEAVGGSFVELKGRAENATSVLINGNSVLIDNDGNFNSDLLLASGYNIIGISAKDKFGRVEEKILEVVLK